LKHLDTGIIVCFKTVLLPNRFGNFDILVNAVVAFQPDLFRKVKIDDINLLVNCLQNSGPNRYVRHDGALKKFIQLNLLYIRRDAATEIYQSVFNKPVMLCIPLHGGDEVCKDICSREAHV